MDELDKTKHLLGAVLGGTVEETRSLQAVFKALGTAGKQVMLELPWYPGGGTHQIVLKARDGDRVTFYNSLRHRGKKPGDSLRDGLKRRIEPDGVESCALSDLEPLFRAAQIRAFITTLP